MKLSYGSIIFVLAIFAAVIVAGCTVTSPSGPAASPGGATTAPAASKAPSGGLTTLGSAIDFTKVKWYEYQMTATTPGAGTSNTKMKEEYNVNYNGKTADKVAITADMKQGDTTMTTTTEMYMDKSGNNLGGHMKTMSGGQVTYEMDIPASSSSGGTTTTSNPLSTNTGATLTSLGADTVTVPAGTYACTKYSWSVSGGTGTVWVAPNVPLPVKMESTAGEGTMSMELTGWG